MKHPPRKSGQAMIDFNTQGNDYMDKKNLVEICVIRVKKFIRVFTAKI